ncbi:MAG: WYL domain-containing protein, partial [Eubacterium sp.]|nr:WYL domain-containing protein [Eubacterium sp.]
TEQIDGYLEGFEEPRMFDESTVRKKLKEYESVGIIVSEKHGKTLCYRLAADSPVYDADVLDFFSEVMPCGVIGSFLLDKEKNDHEEAFAFKHHYITVSLDSEIVCTLFMAMHDRKNVTIEVFNRGKDHVTESQVIPLRILISVQSGRQYLVAYSPWFKRITPFRTDNIISVEIGEEDPRFDEFREKLDQVRQHIWGVSTEGRSGERMEHVEFTIRYADDEQHIPRRMEREKRCGKVERIDDNTCRFSADVFDSMELVPWIRTFICRIVDIRFSDERIEKKFKDDIRAMYEMYGLEGGDAS